jgi:hypothetical protein
LCPADATGTGAPLPGAAVADFHANTPAMGAAAKKRLREKGSFIPLKVLKTATPSQQKS